jgi:PKD repeat protein
VQSRSILLGVIVMLLLAAALGHSGDRVTSPVLDLPVGHGVTTLDRHPTTSPTVSASAKPTPADVGSSLNFYGIFSGFTVPYSLNWSFGDGTYSSTQSPEHTYSVAANFTVVFTVSGSCCETTNATFYVLINPTVQSGVSFVPTNPTTSSVVNFTATPTLGTPPYVGFWNFGDGATATGLSVLHTYHTAGSYTVRLWANDSGEGSAPQTLHVTVEGAPAGGGQPTGSSIILIGIGVAVVAVALVGFAYFQWDKKRRPRMPTAIPPAPPP